MMFDYRFMVTDLIGNTTGIWYKSDKVLTEDTVGQVLLDNLDVQTMSSCEHMALGVGAYRTLDGKKEVRRIDDVKLELVDINEVDKVRKILAEQQERHKNDFFIVDYFKNIGDEAEMTGEKALHIVNKLKELADKFGEPDKKVFEIWNETSSGLDNYLGESEGADFKDACINYAKKHKWFFESFDAGKMTFYGSKLIGKIPEE